MVGLPAVKIDAEYKSFVNGSCDTLNIGETFEALAVTKANKPET